MIFADTLTLVCLILTTIFQSWTSPRLRHVVHGADSRGPVYLKLSDAGAILPVLAMCIVPIPLPLFFILLFVIVSLVPSVARGGKNREWLFNNGRFLLFAAPHLVTLGLIALCTQRYIPQVLEVRMLRSLSMIGVTLLCAGLDLVLARRLSQGHLRFIHWDAQEWRLFSGFIWFCIVSVMLDSIPCLFPLPARTPLLFLVGSNILLLLMAFLFARHVYSITRDAYLKEEYLRLQEAAVAQHSRTVQLEREAYIDALTGIYTRRYAMANMADMLRNGEAFVLVFLDLDKLKHINDEQGHLAGDKYLQSFSAHLKSRLHVNDIFARFGGDEFLILLPDRTRKTANEQMAQIQSEASKTPPEGWGEPFSYGLSEALPGTQCGAEEFLTMADSAMYEDKKRRQGEGAR